MTIELTPLQPREAIDYFRSRGLAPRELRFDWRDVWQAEHARMFVVAKAMQTDVLETIREEVDRMLADGLTIQQATDRLRPRLVALGWWGRSAQTDPLTGETREVQLGSNRRLRTIFDTNMRTSRAAGDWARIQRTKALLPFLQYQQLDRPSKREAHMPYHGLVLPVDHPAWAKIFPPNGWFCGCWVRQLSRRQLEREGLSVDEDFQLDEEALTNPRSGVVNPLPTGVDPGFASNPGAAFLDNAPQWAATQGRVPREWRAAEQGLGHELRARLLRDHRESAVAYDLDQLPEGGLIDWQRGGLTSVPLSPAMVRAASDPERRIVLMHTHPRLDQGEGGAPEPERAGVSFSAADLDLVMEMPGMEQIVAIAADGSVFRARQLRPFGQYDATRLESTDLYARQIRRALQASLQSGTVRPRDQIALMSHLLGLVMDQVGLISYDYGASGSLAQLERRHADLIDAIVRQYRR